MSKPGDNDIVLCKRRKLEEDIEKHFQEEKQRQEIKREDYIVRIIRSKNDY